MTKNNPISLKEKEEVEKWIKAIRKLSKKASSSADTKKLLELGNAAEKLISNNISHNPISYKNAVIRFRNAINNTRTAHINSSLLLPKKITSIFSFAIKNLINILKRKKLLKNTQSINKKINLDDFMEKTLGTKGKLEEFLEDRIIANNSEFKQKNEKKVGATTGYIATKKTDPNGLPYMIKTALKDYDKNDNDFKKINFERMSLINEFVTAPLYKRTMYSRTPLISGIVVEDNKDKNKKIKYLLDLSFYTTLKRFLSLLATITISLQLAQLDIVRILPISSKFREQKNFLPAC